MADKSSCVHQHLSLDGVSDGGLSQKIDCLTVSTIVVLVVLVRSKASALQHHTVDGRSSAMSASSSWRRRWSA